MLWNAFLFKCNFKFMLKTYFEAQIFCGCDYGKNVLIKFKLILYPQRNLLSNKECFPGRNAVDVPIKLSFELDNS